MIAIIRASCPPSVCGLLRGRGVRGGICVVCGAGAMPATRSLLSVRAERLSAAGRPGAVLLALPLPLSTPWGLGAALCNVSRPGDDVLCCRCCCEVAASFGRVAAIVK